MSQNRFKVKVTPRYLELALVFPFFGGICLEENACGLLVLICRGGVMAGIITDERIV